MIGVHGSSTAMAPPATSMCPASCAGAARLNRPYIGVIADPPFSSELWGDLAARPRLTAWLATPGSDDVKPLVCNYNWEAIDA